MLGDMDKVLAERLLRSTEDQISDGARRIAEQRELIRELVTLGLDVQHQRALLKSSEEAQRLRVEHRDDLLRELDHYFAIIDSAEDAIISKSLDGVIHSWNHAAEQMFGYTLEEAIGKSITLIIPEDRRYEEPVILDKIRRGERIRHFETLRQRKDGSLIDISLTISPILDSERRVVGASKIARDISEFRRAREHQQLLLREMTHRVKNLFALATSVVALSGRSAQTPQDVVKSACERLAALARAHPTTLSQTEDRQPVATTLQSLIQAVVAPFNEYASGQTPRTTILGNDTAVSGSALTNLALLFHELVTNAAKYGALSTTTGGVEAVCTEAKGTVTISWTECGGPLVSEPPARDGFGTILAGKAAQALEGKIERQWRPEGLAVRLTFPSSRLSG
jgi:PAS domain S-box-containing protein